MGIVFLNEKNEAAETRRHVFAKPKISRQKEMRNTTANA